MSGSRLGSSCPAAPKQPSSVDPPLANRTVHLRLILARWPRSRALSWAVTPDRAEGLQYHVLPTDDPLRALNACTATIQALKKINHSSIRSYAKSKR